jgi:transcriptional regulator with XRE-family HTH domain
MSEDLSSGPEPSNGAGCFGVEVRVWRTGAGMSQRELAERAGYEKSYVAKVEAGDRLGSPAFATACDETFGAPGVFTRLRKWVGRNGYPSWFVPYLELERQAAGILDYSATLVMGLLQTADYARAVFRAGFPREDPDVIEAKVARRLQRRAVLEGDKAPVLWCVLNEACLRTPVGGPKVMGAQLAHLLEMAESPQVTLQILPFAIGAPPATEGFTLLTFDDGPSIAYVDTALAGQMIDSVAVVANAVATYDQLRAAALHPDESLAMIRRAMEEYEA